MNTDTHTNPPTNPPVRKFRYEEHHVMVDTLMKDPREILAYLIDRPHLVDFWHAATGVAGEAGELLDCVKKSAIYGKPLDVDNLIEEMGDLEFYLSRLRTLLRVTRDTILKANTEKLNKRYADGKYSDQQAQVRADKVEEVLKPEVAQHFNNCEGCGVLIGRSYHFCEACLAKPVPPIKLQPPPVPFEPNKYFVITDFDMKVIKNLGYFEIIDIIMKKVKKYREDTNKLKPDYIVVSSEFPEFYEQVKQNYMQVIAQVQAYGVASDSELNK